MTKQLPQIGVPSGRAFGAETLVSTTLPALAAHRPYLCALKTALEVALLPLLWRLLFDQREEEFLTLLPLAALKAR